MTNPEKNALREISSAQDSSSAVEPTSWSGKLTELLESLQPLTNQERLTSTPEERAELEAKKLIPFERIEAFRQRIADVLNGISNGISNRLPDYGQGSHRSRLYGHEERSYLKLVDTQGVRIVVFWLAAIGMISVLLAIPAINTIGEGDIIGEVRRLYPNAQIITVSEIAPVRSGSHVLAAGEKDGRPFTAECASSWTEVICSIDFGGDDQSDPSSNQNEKPRSLPH